MCRVQCPIRHITGHFGDESFQAIDCTGTDNQTIANRKYTKHKITNPNTKKLVVVKTWSLNLNLKQFISKNCSYQCAYDCAQVCYTIQHKTVLIIFPLVLQTIIIAQMLSNWKGDLSTTRLPFKRRRTTRECVYSCDVDLDAKSYKRDLYILRCTCNTKMKFLGQGFHKLEHKQDRLTDRQTDANKHINSCTHRW